jgi:predicted ATP-grasp superfamily ATP-dependent carboligase
MRIFIYECITAGGMGANVPESLLLEGGAMLDAIVIDMQWPDVDVVMLRNGAETPADFRAIAASSDWTLVIAPEFDDLLASRAQTVRDVGGRLLGPSPAAIRCTADKLYLASIWHQAGVPHPRTILFESQMPVFPVPCVVKPRDGAGSQAMLMAFGESDLPKLQRAREEWPHGDLLLQQYIPGQPASVALLIGPVQTIALAPARQHLSRDFRFRYEGGSLPLPPPLARRATKLALQAVAGIDGLQGYVGVDLILGEDGDDYAIEINPRLTTSYIGLRQLCEQNLAELMLRVVQGLPIEAPTWKAVEVQFDADGTIRKTSSTGRRGAP